MYLDASEANRGEHKLLILGKPFFIFRFMGCVATVVASSTWTSLIPSRAEWLMQGSGSEEGNTENDKLPLGDEFVLPTGLIWVAISLRETTRETIFSSSLVPSSLSSVISIQKQETPIKHKLYCHRINAPGKKFESGETRSLNTIQIKSYKRLA